MYQSFRNVMYVNFVPSIGTFNSFSFRENSEKYPKNWRYIKFKPLREQPAAIIEYRTESYYTFVVSKFCLQQFMIKLRTDISLSFEKYFKECSENSFKPVWHVVKAKIVNCESPKEGAQVGGRNFLATLRIRALPMLNKSKVDRLFPDKILI